MKIRQPIVTVAGHVDHGKCVSGDTLIPLVDGTIISAKNLFENYFNEKLATKIEDGILQDVRKKEIKVHSFDGKKIIEADISHIWKRKADKLIEIKTASGDIIKTTPEHPFFTFALEGLNEVAAKNLNKGDYIAAPKNIALNNSDVQKGITAKLESVDNFICFVNGKFDKVFKELQESNLKDIERRLKIKHLGESARKGRFRVRDIFKLAEFFNIDKYELYTVISSIKNANEGWRVGHTSKTISLPNPNEPEKLGYILGCIAGNGHISKVHVILNNNDSEIQETYRNYLKELFKIDSEVRQGHTCQIVIDNGGMTLVRFMTEIIGFPKKNKSAAIEVPEIAKRNKEVFRGFFSGLLDTDGYISKINNSIEITSKSKNLIKQCSILLLNHGIHSVAFEKNGFYYLRIANKIYLDKVLENFKPRLKRKFIRITNASTKAESSRIFDILPLKGKILKELNVPGKINKKVPYYNKYIKSSILSTQFLKSVLENLKQENKYSENIRKQLESEVSFVKVVSKKEIKNKEKYVYDFTIPDIHNFVAERVLVHNTSILDCFRSTYVQETEPGGITQKISFTKFPFEQVKKACPLINTQKIKLEIPGFLFIDTPGHAAFTNLRKRGGSLADLAILVVAIKEGIKPQTQEVLQILKAHKTPFIIALNKLDTLSGWHPHKEKTLKESIESQAINVSQEFQEALLTFQGALSQHGFESDLFYDITDFTKKIAIVPCSAKTSEGVSELLLTLCGLSQKFLKEKLVLEKDAKAVILEIKKEKAIDRVETILYDGILKEGEKVAIATMDDAVVSKVRAIEEIQPLSYKYRPVKEAIAATGIRLQLTNKTGILPGMPLQKINNNLYEIKQAFKKEISQTLKLDKQGIIIKADSLGSLEALITLLKQENIKIVKAAIGPISKSDIISARANLEINPLDAIILGFNVGLEEDSEPGNIKILTNDVIYKLIEELQTWRQDKQSEIERERLMSLTTLCKLEILHEYVFRNLNPAIFGVHIHAGKIKTGLKLINQEGEEVARIKSIQQERESVQEASEGDEVAIALPGVNFERKLKEAKYLYSDITENQFKKFETNKDLLSQTEIKTLQEIAEIKRKEKDDWGA